VAGRGLRQDAHDRAADVEEGHERQPEPLEPVDAKVAAALAREGARREVAAEEEEEGHEVRLVEEQERLAKGGKGGGGEIADAEVPSRPDKGARAVVEDDDGREDSLEPVEVVAAAPFARARTLRRCSVERCLGIGGCGAGRASKHARGQDCGGEADGEGVAEDFIASPWQRSHKCDCADKRQREEE